MNNTVILAFSGWLDTSFSIPYLMEQGYEIITVTCDSSGFTAEDLLELESKSKKLGAKKHYTIDIKDDLFDEIIALNIKTNSLYENSYPNLCADRYIIAAKCVEIAKKENATYIAHWSTAMWNDQVRFNLAIENLAPHLQILEPIKEVNGDRNTEIEYLTKKGFEVPLKHKKYSINQNIMGITYSGSEIDKNQEPNKEMFLWVTGEKISEERYFDIYFESGIPVSIDGKKMKGSEIMSYLNIELWKYGYGKNYYTGDCIIGIKWHIAIEAPALYFLIKAHIAIEQYTLTKLQFDNAHYLSKQVTDLIYNGKLYDPAMTDLEVYFNSVQKNVTGNVKMKIEYGNALPVSVDSPNSLINSKIATYAQGCSWTKEEAAWFIKLYWLQSKVANSLQKMQ